MKAMAWTVELMSMCLEIVNEVDNIKRVLIGVQTCTTTNHLHIENFTGCWPTQEYAFDLGDIDSRGHHTNIDENIHLSISKLFI